MTVSIRPAADDDVAVLAEMNKRLIEDEGHRNPMSLPQLADRMRAWLHDGWRADLFLGPGPPPDAAIVGYALYQHRRDEYTPDRPEVYLRQFYIERAERNKGIGRRAMRMLVDGRFPPRCTVVVDVLAGNRRGLAFWQTVGFAPYQITLRAEIGD